MQIELMNLKSFNLCIEVFNGKSEINDYRKYV